MAIDTIRHTAVIFDLDGTLVDTAHDLHASLNVVLDRAGRSPVTLDSVRKMIGKGARVLVQRGFEATGGMPDEATFEEHLPHFFEYYRAHVADKSRPFPGALECLEAFRSVDARLGICTNKPLAFTEALLDGLEIAQYFHGVKGGDNVSIKKPDAAAIHETLEAMGARPEEAVMIGDTATDINAARNAGILSVAVTFGYTPVPAQELGADIVIDHFDELIPALSRVA